MKKYLCALIFCWIFWVPQAQALSQFRAVVKQASTLFGGPGDQYPSLSISLAEGEVVLVLGTSTGGIWLNVMKADGAEGWVIKTRADLYRIPPFELDEMEDVLQRKRRIVSSWVIDTGIYLASDPNAAGAAVTVWGVPFKNGLMGKKIDQFEIGAGFIYAARVFTNNALDGTTYGEMPFMVQWMFRLPPRGGLMIGPKGGLSLIQDNGDKSNQGIAFMWGAQIRYFPFDDVGYYLEIVANQRSKSYITRQMGMSFRF